MRTCLRVRDETHPSSAWIADWLFDLAWLIGSQLGRQQWSAENEEGRVEPRAESEGRLGEA